jgi:hypothetical protein
MRRTLMPWGITVIRIHPSSVSGTEFNDRVVREGGIRYRSIPLGRISRERLARHLVQLAEQPRRELFISRLYDPLVFLNRRLPGLVDFFTSRWVRNKRKKELPPSEEVAPVHYESSSPVWQLLGAAAVFMLVSRFWRRKS